MTKQLHLKTCNDVHDDYYLYVMAVGGILVDVGDDDDDAANDNLLVMPTKERNGEENFEEMLYDFLKLGK